MVSLQIEGKAKVMRKNFSFIIRILLLGIILMIFWLVSIVNLSKVSNLILISGGVVLTYPLVWIGRKIIDRHRTKTEAEWVTTFLHFGLGFTFGVPIIRAIITHKDWTGWVIPVPGVIGLTLTIITGSVFIMTVANLAIKGSGAPFFIALSRKLTTGWMYSRTRNPMVLAGLALLFSLGIWFQSSLFILWVLLFFTPALLFFIKVFEERELEFRFGKSYLEYRASTPMLFPGKSEKKDKTIR